MLAAIGIIKGRRSLPMRTHGRFSIKLRRPRTRRAASSALRKSSTASRCDFSRPPLDQPPGQCDPAQPAHDTDLPWKNAAGGYLRLDFRIWFFTDYYSISPGMLSKIPGKGAAYLIGFTDSEGAPLSGGETIA